MVNPYLACSSSPKCEERASFHVDLLSWSSLVIMHRADFISKHQEDSPEPNRMLHVEEGKTSQVEQLSDYWLGHLHAIYRHDKLV